MGKTKLPYYPMYVRDFSGDEKVRAMSIGEVGLYVLALNSAWEDGSISEDVEQLSIDIRRRVSEIRPYWKAVKNCFVLHPELSGRLVNPRQEIIRSEASEKSAKARASVESRWLKKKERIRSNGSTDTNVHTNLPSTVSDPYIQAPFIYVSSLSVSREEKRTEGTVTGFRPNFERFASEYPTEVNQMAAQYFCQFARDPKSEEDLFAVLAAWKQTERWKSGHVKSPQNYFASGDWKTFPKEPKRVQPSRVLSGIERDLALAAELEKEEAKA